MGVGKSGGEKLDLPRQPVSRRCADLARSELKLEGQLDGARAADLVEGVEAAALAAAAQPAIQHLGGKAELRRSHEIVAPFMAKFPILRERDQSKRRARSGEGCGTGTQIFGGLL